MRPKGLDRHGCAASAGMGTLLLLLALLIGCVPDITPIPDPINPPVPTPVPVPVPVPAAGFRVLIVFDAAAEMTAEQLGTLNSNKIIDLLNEKCAKGADGRPDWRKWDKPAIDESGLTTESPLWKDIWAKASPQLTKLPAFVIVTNQTLRVVPMPSNEADAIKLLGGSR